MRAVVALTSLSSGRHVTAPGDGLRRPCVGEECLLRREEARDKKGDKIPGKKESEED